MTDYSNRLDLFRSLTVDALDQSIIYDLFSSLLDENYDDFVSLCNYVKTIKDSISNISLSMTEDGEIHFDIALSNGSNHRHN